MEELLNYWMDCNYIVREPHAVPAYTPSLHVLRNSVDELVSMEIREYSYLRFNSYRILCSTVMKEVVYLLTAHLQPLTEVDLNHVKENRCIVMRTIHIHATPVIPITCFTRYNDPLNDNTAVFVLNLEPVFLLK